MVLARLIEKIATGALTLSIGATRPMDPPRASHLGSDVEPPLT